MSERQSGIITGGVFLIGIAALGITRFWWPGTLVVLGITFIVNGLLTGRHWQMTGGGVWMIAIAAVFYFRLPWWILLALTGLVMVLGGLEFFRRSSTWKRKRKNDDLDTQPGDFAAG